MKKKVIMYIAQAKMKKIRTLKIEIHEVGKKKK